MVSTDLNPVRVHNSLATPLIFSIDDALDRKSRDAQLSLYARAGSAPQLFRDRVVHDFAMTWL